MEDAVKWLANECRLNRQFRRHGPLPGSGISGVMLLRRMQDIVAAHQRGEQPPPASIPTPAWESEDDGGDHPRPE
jgi:hypothetical protein